MADRASISNRTRRSIGDAVAWQSQTSALRGPAMRLRVFKAMKSELQGCDSINLPVGARRQGVKSCERGGNDFGIELAAALDGELRSCMGE
jgi:hypothetical protein